MPQMLCTEVKPSTTERLCRTLLVVSLLFSARGQQTVGTGLVVSTGQPGLSRTSRIRKVLSCSSLDQQVARLLFLWAAHSGLKIREFSCGAGSAIRLPIAIRGDAARALLGCPDRTIREVDLNTGIGIRQVGPTRNTIDDIAYSDDGHAVVVAGAVMLFDLSSGGVVNRLPGQYGPKKARLRLPSFSGHPKFREKSRLTYATRVWLVGHDEPEGDKCVVRDRAQTRYVYVGTRLPFAATAPTISSTAPGFS